MLISVCMYSFNKSERKIMEFPKVSRISLLNFVESEFVVIHNTHGICHLGPFEGRKKMFYLTMYPTHFI